MIDLSSSTNKDEILEWVLDSFPGSPKIVVKDLGGNLLYQSTHATSPKCSSNKSNTLHFPWRDASGTIRGTCDWTTSSPAVGSEKEVAVKKDLSLNEATRKARLHDNEESPEAATEQDRSHNNAQTNASNTNTEDEHEEETSETANSSITSNSTAATTVTTTSKGGLSDNPTAKDANSRDAATTVSNSTTEISPTKTAATPLESTSTDDVYHNIFYHVQTAVAINDVLTNDQNEPVDYIFRDVNPAFERFVGKPAKEVLGKKLTEAFPGIEDDDANWIDFFGQVGITGESQSFTQYSEHLQNWYQGLVYRPDPDKQQFVVTFTEVSDQLESQEALRESEERHRNLFESMMQGVVYQDATGNIIMANPAAERILGLTVDQMMGRTSVDPRWKSIREDGSDFPGHEHPSMKALQTGKPVTDVTMGIYFPNDNLHHWIKIDAIPRFKPGSSEAYQVYTTFTDITDTKRFEAKLLRAKEKAEETDKLKSAFLANMSHEIRTPLNGIMGNIDLALSNRLADEWRQDNLEGLQIAKSSGSLLLSIIQDILDLSKIEAGQMKVHNDEPFSLHAMMQQTTSLAQSLLHTKNVKFGCEFDIRFHAQIEKNIPHDVIQGDPFRLQQVVNNLVSNAIKFTSVGKVQFQVSMVPTNVGSDGENHGAEGENHGAEGDTNSDKMLQFSVLDTGKGIPSTHLDSIIFEPFRQVDISDTRQHGGTGLGLTISRKLVQMMGGELRAESSVLGPIRGSLFAFTLPFRPVPPDSTKLTNDGLKEAPVRMDSTVDSVTSATSSHRSDIMAGSPSPHPIIVNPLDGRSLSRSGTPKSETKSDLASSAHTRTQASITTKTESESSEKKIRILVAEDDPVSRKLVSRMLQRSGYDVLLACDGEEVVDIYVQTRNDVCPPSLILMDVQMPKRDGLESTRAIRDKERKEQEKQPQGSKAPPIPIIALSAGAMKGDQERGLSIGMTDYLTKPVCYKALIATLDKYIGQNTASQKRTAAA